MWFIVEVFNCMFVEFEYCYFDCYGEGWEGVCEGVGSGWLIYFECYVVVVQCDSVFV